MLNKHAACKQSGALTWKKATTTAMADMPRARAHIGYTTSI